MYKNKVAVTNSFLALSINASSVSLKAWIKLFFSSLSKLSTGSGRENKMKIVYGLSIERKLLIYKQYCTKIKNTLNLDPFKN